jgi:hypothetical protein
MPGAGVVSGRYVTATGAQAGLMAADESGPAARPGYTIEGGHADADRIATVRAHGGDPTIGPRLRALLATVGLDSLRDVERAARDPERTFYQARIHQLWGRRPD